MEYVAYDFETANSNRSSACALGAVRMKNGKEIDHFYTLINPKETFGGYEQSIHGITKEDVREAPDFNTAFEDFINFIDQTPIISHTPFDREVIGAASQKNAYEFEPIAFLDSWGIARSLWKHKYSSFSLKKLAKALNYSYTAHHALEDARACAFIIEALAEDAKVDSLFELQKKAGYNSMGRIVYDEDFQQKVPTKASNLTGKEIKELMSQVDEDSLDPWHPFYKKKIVITGKVSPNFTQGDYQTMIIEYGGHPQQNVTTATDILVEGEQTSRTVKEGQSRKSRKAMKLFNEGYDISIMSAEDFLNSL